MLRITVPFTEQWDPIKEEFVIQKEQTLQLEHSLISLSKWESKWCKPFLTKDEKTPEEIIDYIACMTITPNVDPNTYTCLTSQNMREVGDYIDAPMTATTIKEQQKSFNREIITAEIIYYWMIANNIPFECQKWHLNKLLTLISVCNIKNQKPKKMSKKETMSHNKALNEARKQQMNTAG